MSNPSRRVDLATMINAAADGRFPDVDGRWSRTPLWRADTEGVVAFTGHAVIAVGEEVSDGHLDQLGVHGFGGAHDPRTTAALAGSGPIGILDVLTVTRGRGPGGARPDDPALVPREDLRGHPRVRHAAETRDDIQVFGWDDPGDSSVVTLARGIAGLPEIGLELMGASAQDGVLAEPDRTGRQRGARSAATDLLTGALRLIPPGEPVLASVSPGNARSLRLFLRCGFTPIGSVQLWTPQRHSTMPDDTTPDDTTPDDTTPNGTATGGAHATTTLPDSTAP